MRCIRRNRIVLAASLAVVAVCAVIVVNGRVGPAEPAMVHAVDRLPGWLYRGRSGLAGHYPRASRRTVVLSSLATSATTAVLGLLKLDVLAQRGLGRRGPAETAR